MKNAIRDATRRSIELFLDEWATLSASMPDCPERREMDKRAGILEEELINCDGIRLVHDLAEGGFEIPDGMLDEEERLEQAHAEHLAYLLAGTGRNP